MWKLELDESYFRIYDSHKLIAGYFDPDYGDIFPKENQDQIIAGMLKNHDKISGGFIMVPLIKFGLFDSDLSTDIISLEQKISTVYARIQKWKDFLASANIQYHNIGISHTDQDMLTITFPVKFVQPTPLDNKLIANEIASTLDSLQRSDLL